MNQRREALKIYLFALLADDKFAGARSPLTIAKKALSIFATDVPAVAVDFAKLVAVQDGSKAAAFVMDKIGDLFAMVEAKGPKVVWDDMQAQYKRGMKVNAAARARK